MLAKSFLHSHFADFWWCVLPRRSLSTSTAFFQPIFYHLPPLQLVEVLEGAILCGVAEVAQAVLLRGTMGGLCRFAISSFRRVPRRGSSAAFLVDLINILESTPQLSEMIRREMHATWDDFVRTDIAMHNGQRRHVFDQGSDDHEDDDGEINGATEAEPDGVNH